MLPDVDMAFINNTFAQPAGLTLDDALLKEGAESPYVNIIAVRAGDEDKESIQQLSMPTRATKWKPRLRNCSAPRRYLAGNEQRRMGTPGAVRIIEASECRGRPLCRPLAL